MQPYYGNIWQLGLLYQNYIRFAVLAFTTSHPHCTCIKVYFSHHTHFANLLHSRLLPRKLDDKSKVFPQDTTEHILPLSSGESTVNQLWNLQRIITLQMCHVFQTKCLKEFGQRYELAEQSIHEILGIKMLMAITDPATLRRLFYKILGCLREFVPILSKEHVWGQATIFEEEDWLASKIIFMHRNSVKLRLGLCVGHWSSFTLLSNHVYINFGYSQCHSNDFIGNSIQYTVATRFE